MGASHGAPVAKNLPASVGYPGDGSISGPGRSPRVGNANTQLQHALLENPMGKGAWRATTHGAAKGQTQLSEHKTTAFIIEAI